MEMYSNKKVIIYFTRKCTINILNIHIIITNINNFVTNDSKETNYISIYYTQLFVSCYGYNKRKLKLRKNRMQVLYE